MKQLVVAVALGALLALPAAATTFVRVADEALADQAPLAVVATVLARAAAPGRAATDYRLRVDEVLAGSAPGELVVRLPGGGAGKLRLKLWGVPAFRPGERTLLFLSPAGDGTWRVLHLFLGAFHQVRAGDRELAVRNLAEAHEVRVTPEGGVAPAPADAEPLRDFAAFARWVKARRQGTAPPDYRLPATEAEPLRALAAKATFFTVDDMRLRWFPFDSGGHVDFLAYSTGEQGLSGGGYSEFQTALNAWNAESQTPIDYRYAGKTSVANGLDEDGGDELSTIVFNDPHHLLSAFSCTSGGVLALGGPWYESGVETFHGEQFHPIAAADIVVNDGLSCFFSHSPNASKAAQELFGHELGHTLGLGHSCGDADGPDPDCSNATLSDALMRAFVHDDARGASLRTDDQQGIRSLYKQTTDGSVPAAPTGLVATPLGTHEIQLSWVDNANNETSYLVEFAALGEAFVQATPTLDANTTSATVSGLATATGYRFRVRARNAAGDSAYSNVAEAATNAPIAPCVADANTLCVHNDRFAVEVAWKIDTGATGVGTAVPIAADDGGLFWFFGADNPEMLVKVLNACVPSLGNKYWVFFAATTTVQFTTTVIDTQTGAVKAYFNEQGHRADAVTDVGAFATCP
ncbi:MAG TPA: fibronectin type III domain-containing protein [Thermoanaerobaculia bacterium]|jgi:hypothetical protein|nr:fibronectin type III domain-containing protein [Thermoanaerobaculia bacterium]